MTIKYVRKTGSDGNDGNTPATAYLTILKAETMTVANDIIDIGAGTWAENFAAVRSYYGASMFGTFVNGLWTMPGSSLGIQVKRLRFTFGVGQGQQWNRNFVAEDVHFDFAFNVPCAFMRISNAGETLTTTRCIFQRLTSAGLFYVRSAGGAITVDHCVLYNIRPTEMAIFWAYVAGSSLHIKNSIFHTCSRLMGWAASWSPFDVSFSDFYNSGSIPAGAPGCLSVDPLFVDPAAGDFSLLSTSPCIGAGQP